MVGDVVYMLSETHLYMLDTRIRAEDTEITADMFTGLYPTGGSQKAFPFYGGEPCS